MARSPISFCRVGEHPRIATAIALVIGVAAAGLQLGAQQPESSSYLVGPQDVLKIIVFDEEDLSGSFTVDAGGTITFPLLTSRVPVDGLTVREIQVEITRQLGDGFLVNPQVSIDVEEYRSQSVYVFGEVASPGIYTLSGDLTLMEVLVTAGGVTAQAGNVVQIIRSASGVASSTRPVLPGDAESQIEELSLEDINTGRLTLVTLRDGDTVNVPKAATFYVLGQVSSPGPYVWFPGMTVQQALALASGYTSRGSTRGIKITRMVDGSRTEISVTEESLVQPGDTIEIRTRRF